MGWPRSDISQVERRALLGIWSVPGIGPVGLDRLYDRLGELGPVLTREPRTWVPQRALSAVAEAALRAGPCLDALAEQVERAARQGGMGVAFIGDPAYPRNLAEVADAPPLLFYRGEVSPPRRRAALVGTRRPEQKFYDFLTPFAEEVAGYGVGIVSGAARGIDARCHQAALEVGQETLAFLGSALDVMDPAQAALVPGFLAGAGVFYSELPPGVRASQRTFPRRNRLISGAADVVVILRAGVTSGALHTARYAQKQGRPLLAVPGDPGNKAAAGANALLREGAARLCMHPLDVVRAAGLAGEAGERPADAARSIDWSDVSSAARSVYESLEAVAEYEELLVGSRLSSGALTSALCELELLGLVVQRPGKRYERL